MKLCISFRAARAAALVAVTARLFMGLVVDAPTTQNGAWLCPLIGGLLAAPLVFLLSRKDMSPVLYVPVGALVLVDAASVLAATSRSAGYLALDRSPALLLSLPVAIAVLWCLWRGGDAVGYAAMIWARVALALLAGVILLQVPCFHTAWLSPVLGEGWRAILDGGVKAAGWTVAASSVLALPEKKESDSRVLPSLLCAVSTASLLILLRCMLAPTQLRSAWLNRLDALLCNGREPLYLQLPLIVLWFAGHFHLLVCELFAAAGCVKRLSGRLNDRLCALIAVSLVLMLSRLATLGEWMERISSWSFAAIGIAMIISCILPKGKGGERACDEGV